MILQGLRHFPPLARSRHTLLYTGFHMRRGASILLLVIFLLGPLSAALGDSEAGLPACCRRNGAHHCSMGRLRAAILASGQPIATAPSTCPSYPGDNALTTAPLHGLASATTAAFVLRTAPLSPAVARAAARVTAARTRSSRAPPIQFAPTLS
jgi:hypothetical protein